MMDRRRWMFAGLTTLGSASLLGCAGPSIDDYAQTTPILDFRKYFTGAIDAWGIFTDRSGKVVKRFTVAMDCQWQNNQGVLDEDFSYADGSKEKRIWKITDQGQGVITGTAGDVVGMAQGQTKGNAFHWRYTLVLPVSGNILNVEMDDWMYMMNERVMLNKTSMSKFGVHLGDVTLSFTKRG